MAELKPATNDTVRKTWDDEAFAQRARQRAAQDALEEPGSKRRKVPFVPAENRIELAPRAPGEQFDPDTVAGSSVVIPDGAVKSESGGFYCKHCDVLSHDSSAHLNHMNSRAHQAVMGIAMRVTRSSAEDVRRAFAAALERRKAREAAFGRPPLTLDELLQRRKAETAAMKSAKAAEKRRAEDAKERSCASRGVVTFGDDGVVSPSGAPGADAEAAANDDATHVEGLRRAGLPTSF
jgi:U4/U6.U5 tri-snRNP component SNU23